MLRVATFYNIHKGVQGLGRSRRPEIHNLGLVRLRLEPTSFRLQEVRK